jgi:1-acyl-sn-glycerol-3-phosphate acyltransferase
MPSIEKQAAAPPAKAGLGLRALTAAVRLAARALFRLTVAGRENIPWAGAALLTMNHLGGADPILVIAFSPRPIAAAGKVEILRWPVLGWAAKMYGMIPLHRGEADREALRRLLAELARGQALLIAPEGRESHTGALEAGHGGPAFLAQHAQAPIMPIAITGTAWNRVLPAWRRLTRPCVTLTFGVPYRLPDGIKRAAAAEMIMQRIAALLPPEYRGVYGEQGA